jgi:hypothetical protein
MIVILIESISGILVPLVGFESKSRSDIAMIGGGSSMEPITVAHSLTTFYMPCMQLLCVYMCAMHIQLIR